MENIFGIFGEFRNKNPRETVPEGGTRQGGAPHPPGRAPDPCGHLIRRVVPFFFRKKASIRIETVLKFQPNRSYGSLGI